LYDNGKISGLLGITYDITKIKAAESALFESEQKYRRIFENIQDVFYQTDEAGIITEISPSIKKHSGYSRDEVIGKPVTDFYHDIEDRKQLFETIKTNRIVSDYEVLLKTKAGEKRYSSVNAQLIVRNGEVKGTEGSMRDVTERKLQQDSLKSLNHDLNTLNDQKNKLLSVIAHDLRNPISGCVGLLEVVFMDIENTSKEELVEYMEMMQKGVLNAYELLEDLLEWARIQFDSVDFIPSLIEDLASNIRHTLNKIIPLAQAKQIEVKHELKDGMSIMADKHMLASIIRNLVTNAIKFSNKDSIVVIAVKRNSTGYLFSVSDNGIGIPARDIGKLFSDDTGFTSDGTLGEKGTGMGLGLCRNFVEKHGGRIWVESAEGAGSTFYFTIPDQENLH
jgi:PAS domain S-box-containing protein